MTGTKIAPFLAVKTVVLGDFAYSEPLEIPRVVNVSACPIKKRCFCSGHVDVCFRIRGNKVVVTVVLNSSRSFHTSLLAPPTDRSV